MASSAQKTKVKPPVNFMEALQNLGKEVIKDTTDQVAQVFNSDIPDSLGLKSSTGQLNPNESFSLSDILSAEKRGELNAEKAANARLAQVREEERIMAQRREEQAKGQIKTILEEIKLLSKSLGDLGKEAQIAALQAPTNPGIYHRNFFEQLKNFIRDMRRRVQHSREWLAVQSSRSQRRKGMYWANVKSSGTKYMLSGERYMVTTTG
jgi:hypothetical protein